MIVKLINGEIVEKPDKIVFTNPPDSLLKEYDGYKDYVEEEKPDYNLETEKLVPIYTESESTVFCTFKVESINEEKNR